MLCNLLRCYVSMLPWHACMHLHGHFSGPEILAMLCVVILFPFRSRSQFGSCLVGVTLGLNRTFSPLPGMESCLDLALGTRTTFMV